jgi:hypothetical protein
MTMQVMSVLGYTDKGIVDAIWSGPKQTKAGLAYRTLHVHMMNPYRHHYDRPFELVFSKQVRKSRRR